MRIAMWSGPRNISTAMMYAFAARGDCEVVDEPFYASYLHLTGIDHPLREEIIASQPIDPVDVITNITGPISHGFAHSYHKHMTQHMIPDVPRDWINGFQNVFLIRHPARVIASYAVKRENPTLKDIGFPQQAAIFEQVRADRAVVVDSVDIRQNPRHALAALCEAIGLNFSESMLSWPKGGHPADGIWAKHWYGAVWNSTGFGDPEGPLPDVPDDLSHILQEAMPYYDYLRKNSLYIG
ncbi:MAG: HAD family hydrolase [Pseudomonadota bacterium]